MPRLKFEKQFQKQLQNRELRPSEGAWEKLEARLKREDKRRSPLFWWIGIAASVVGGLFIFNTVDQDQPLPKNKVVVETPVEEVQVKEENKIKSGTQISTEETQLATETREGPETTTKAIKEKFSTAPRSDGSMAANQSVPGLHEPEKASPASDLKSDVNANQAEPLLVQRSDIAFALEKEMKSESGEVTDAEIDALLANATAEIRNEKPLIQTATLNAQELLEEVETELEHSFRAQVFELLKDGFQKTRTAVVNRNN